jgi:hypothetical protein
MRRAMRYIGGSSTRLIWCTMPLLALMSGRGRGLRAGGGHGGDCDAGQCDGDALHGVAPMAVDGIAATPRPHLWD